MRGSVGDSGLRLRQNSNVALSPSTSSSSPMASSLPLPFSPFPPVLLLPLPLCVPLSCPGITMESTQFRAGLKETSKSNRVLQHAEGQNGLEDRQCPLPPRACTHGLRGGGGPAPEPCLSPPSFPPSLAALPAPPPHLSPILDFSPGSQGNLSEGEGEEGGGGGGGWRVGRRVKPSGRMEGRDGGGGGQFRLGKPGCWGTGGNNTWLLLARCVSEQPR